MLESEKTLPLTESAPAPVPGNNSDKIDLVSTYALAPEAAELLHPEVFTSLPPDQQKEVLQVCGVDPNSPNALDVARKKVIDQTVKMGKKLLINKDTIDNKLTA